MRLVLSAFALIALACAVSADAEKFDKRAQLVATAVATSHVNYGKVCAKYGLNVWARRQYERALEICEDHEAARAALGYKRVNGNWLVDEKKAPPAKDASKVSDSDRAGCRKALRELGVSCIREFTALAQAAEKEKLEGYARGAWMQVLYYDPMDERALKGAGWEKTAEGDWLSPEDAAERAATKQLLNNAAKPQKLEELPGWVADVWAKGSGRRGVQSGRARVYGTHAQLDETAKYAQAALAICDELFGKREESVAIALCETEEAFAAYCKRLHPDDFDLVKNDYVVGTEAVAIKTAADKDFTFERAVFALALCEVRDRCGNLECPWFENGLSSYLTQRLTGRVTTAEIPAPALPKRTGSWKRALKQLVASGDEPQVAALVVAIELSETQRVLAHFFVRYLCVQKTDGLAKLCKVLAGTEATGAEVMDAAFGQSAQELQAGFLAWFARH